MISDVQMVANKKSEGNQKSGKLGVHWIIKAPFKNRICTVLSEASTSRNLKRKPEVMARNKTVKLNWG